MSPANFSAIIVQLTSWIIAGLMAAWLLQTPRAVARQSTSAVNVSASAEWIAGVTGAIIAGLVLPLFAGSLDWRGNLVAQRPGWWIGIPVAFFAGVVAILLVRLLSRGSFSP